MNNQTKLLYDFIVSAKLEYETEPWLVIYVPISLIESFNKLIDYFLTKDIDRKHLSYINLQLIIEEEQFFIDISELDKAYTYEIQTHLIINKLKEKEKENGNIN